MAEPAKQNGLTRGKAVLIGVLGVVLTGVLYTQFGSSGDEPSVEPAAYTPLRPAVRPATAAPSPAKQAQTETTKEPNVAAIVDVTKWKAPELASVVDHDPFALPETFPRTAEIIGGAAGDAEGLVAAAAADEQKRLAEAVEQLQRQLEELQQRGVQVILRERAQYAAMIGDRTLRVGDEINGFTVTGIDPSGVRVERKESP